MLIENDLPTYQLFIKFAWYQLRQIFPSSEVEWLHLESQTQKRKVILVVTNA